MGRVLVSASHYNDLCQKAKYLLESNGHEVIYDESREFPAYSAEELKVVLQDIDAAIVGMDLYNEEIFSHAPRLKAVAKFGVGVDNIDCDAASRHGVKVINAPGQNSNAVAELTVALIICVCRSVIPINRAIEEGVWMRAVGEEIKGKTVGLIGFGAIAQMVAEKLRMFQANVIACDLQTDHARAVELGVRMTNMDEVTVSSDVVSLHIPSGPETYHLFDEARLRSMKKGAYLINTARGDLVDINALARALNDGHLRGAALDAFETEPLPKESPILNCGNVICTPHTGSETREAYENVSISTAKDVIAVLNGEEPRFWVNR